MIPPVADHAGRDPAPSDWLDICCWGCGADDFLQDSGGRLLCRTCVDRLLAPEDDDTDALAVSFGAYWGSHPLERCWRCMREAVDPDHEVGLCPGCRRHLGRPVAGGR